MTQSSRMPCLLALLAFASCSNLRVHQAEAALADGEHDRVLRGDGFALSYKLVLPKGDGARAESKWPLLLFLHGAGERGDELELVAFHGPVKIARTRPLPFVIVAPQCPAGRAWRKHELIALLDEVCAAHRIDRSRVLVTGLSMGGYGSWSPGLAYPERFAAIATICGGGETLTPRMHGPKRRDALRTLGVWAFHGAADRVVVPAESERMVQVLESLGAKPKLTLYDGVGHNSWSRAYADPELWAWLAAQRRAR